MCAGVFWRGSRSSTSRDKVYTVDGNCGSEKRWFGISSSALRKSKSRARISRPFSRFLSVLARKIYSAPPLLGGDPSSGDWELCDFISSLGQACRVIFLVRSATFTFTCPHTARSPHHGWWPDDSRQDEDLHAPKPPPFECGSTAPVVWAPIPPSSRVVNALDLTSPQRGLLCGRLSAKFARLCYPPRSPCDLSLATRRRFDPF